MNIDKKKLLKDMGLRYLAARKAKGYTQEYAAEIADVTQQAISDSELGKTFLSPDGMLKLCYEYEISTDYLLTGRRSDLDHMILEKKLHNLDSQHFDHLSAIIDHYIAAVQHTVEAEQKYK